MRNRSPRPRCARRAVVVAFIASLLWGSIPTAFAQAGPVLADARREAGRLALGDATNDQAAAASNPGWVTRHPVVVGMVIGTGVGAVLSRVDAIGGYRHDPRVALVGTAVGAWGGLIGSAVHKARTGQKVGIGAKIGIAAGAVAAVVLPLLACYGAGGCGGSS